jgi:hypothetical protein
LAAPSFTRLMIDDRQERLAAIAAILMQLEARQRPAN